jgi:hypothetical protein
MKSRRDVAALLGLLLPFMATQAHAQISCQTCRPALENIADIWKTRRDRSRPVPAGRAMDKFAPIGVSGLCSSEPGGE